jgi:hypothetical protein
MCKYAAKDLVAAAGAARKFRRECNRRAHRFQLVSATTNKIFKVLISKRLSWPNGLFHWQEMKRFFDFSLS